MTDYVAHTWARHAGSSSVAADALEHLLARYREPHRRYHTVDHLVAVWRALDDSVAVDASEAAELYLAAGYHDAIYEPTADDNEERSAEFAAQELRRMGHDEQRIARVRQMILDTKTHEASSASSAALQDADMAILAADRATYERYAAATRQEYAMFSDQQWIAGRTAVLQRMLQRPIFHCGGAREAAARANIAYELAHLADGNIS